MIYGSVCSGIEAATVAWSPLGWKAAWFSEIEKFPSAVLHHHYPEVPNLGDMTKLHKEEIFNDTDIDVLIGGTPCQSFSVAGLRKGMDDPRGNLALTFLSLIDTARPSWVVWENVPGVLSSSGGRDFGAFLGGLAELGYGFAYRVLDAQFFGVPQRRRRVFVVGYLGDWRPAAAVLFERHSLSGHPAPSREKGKRVAAAVISGPPFSRIGNERVEAEAMIFTQNTRDEVRFIGGDGQIAGALAAEAGMKQQNYVMAHGQGNAEIRRDGSPSLTCNHEAPILTLETLQDKGYNALNNQEVHDASSQKTDAGALLSRVREEVGEKAFAKWGLGIFNSLQSPEVLREALHGQELRPTTFSRCWLVYCSLSCEESKGEGALQSLREAFGKGCPPQGWESSKQLHRELGAYMSELSQLGAQHQRFLQDMWQASEGFGVLRQALSAIQEMGRPFKSEGQPAHAHSIVRRLTPIECEFLMGLPRNYTRIPWRGKDPENCPDGPRYKALGNSMAVPVIRWLGERIEMVESLK